MKNNIKFTFIVPNYNKGIYIEECLASIYNQTYNNYEVIVIDDGSTDNSVEEINKFSIDKFLVTNRRQAGGARNEGLKYAAGDYIIFLDSDDYLTNNKVLEKLSNLINDEDIIFLNFTKDNFGKIQEMIENEEPISVKIEKTNLLGCPTKCFKRELIKELVFPENKRYEDIIFTLEALCKTQNYTYFKESFFTYRKVPNSNATSPLLEEAQLDILEEIIRIYRLCVKYPNHKNSLINRIKGDKIPLRLDILNTLIETGENKYKDYF